MPMKRKEEKIHHGRTAWILALLFVSVCLFFPKNAAALEKLSNKEMRSLTGQAGITFAPSNAVFEYWSDAVKIQDVNTRDRTGTLFSPDGYVSFDLYALMVADDLFDLDIGVFNETDALEFTDETPDGNVTRTFEHPLNNTAMVFLSHTANEPQFNLNLNSIAVYNHGTGQESLIGDLDVSGINLYESRLNIYPPASDGTCGLRAIAGARTEIESLIYANPDQLENVAVSNVMLGSGFSGDPSAPENWTYDEGMFELGIPYYFHDDPEAVDDQLDSHPFTLDIATDTDRPGDFQTYMAINAPMRGSIRIKNISSTTSGTSFDMGPIAIDGIRLYKNVVEFPGRGIGN